MASAVHPTFMSSCPTTRSYDTLCPHKIEIVGRYVYWADSETVEAILRTALEGNAVAQFIVGASFEAAGDEGEAADWYEKSAQRGHGPALIKIGMDF